jgi:hypothetical protein
LTTQKTEETGITDQRRRTNHGDTGCSSLDSSADAAPRCDRHSVFDVIFVFDVVWSFTPPFVAKWVGASNDECTELMDHDGSRIDGDTIWLSLSENMSVF